VENCRASPSEYIIILKLIPLDLAKIYDV